MYIGAAGGVLELGNAAADWWDARDMKIQVSFGRIAAEVEKYSWFGKGTYGLQIATRPLFGANCGAFG